MNHTPNYNLPQWELDDLIRMEDFNQMCESIENGVTSAAADAASAMETAENARKTSVAAFGPNNMPYTVGSYTGDGTEIREFSLGFQPRFLIICSSQLTYSADGVGKGMAMAGPSVDSRHIYLTAQGFRLENKDTVNIYPEVNRNGTVYNYIAFR